MDFAKAIVSSTLIMGALIWSIVWVDHATWDSKKNEIEYALDAASYDATQLLMQTQTSDSANQLLDGVNLDDFGKRIQVNHNQVVSTVFDTFGRNVSPTNKYNMPLIGIAGYDLLDVYLTSHGWIGRSSYSYYDSNLNLSFLFTLGDEFEILDYATGVRSVHNLQTYVSPYPNLPMEDFRDYTVMLTLNRVISRAMSMTDANNTVLNTKEGIQLQLPLSDEWRAGALVRNSYQNIIRSPSVFALVDEYGYGHDMRKVRIVSIGGAELMLVN